MTNDDVHDLTGAYVVNALDDGEREAFERHLTSCAPCRQAVDELRDATTALTDPQAPRPELKGGVMCRIATTPQERPDSTER